LCGKAKKKWVSKCRRRRKRREEKKDRAGKRGGAGCGRAGKRSRTTTSGEGVQVGSRVAEVDLGSLKM